MGAEKDFAHRLSQRLIRKLLFSGATLLLLATAGCPRPDRVIDTLPEPTTGYHPQTLPRKPYTPVARPPQLKQQTASTSWLKWPKSTPKRLNSTISPEFGWIPPSGIGHQWECIVVHHSSNDKDTPKSMDAWHRQRGWECLGYDFVIGNGVGYPDGQVFVGPRWTRQMVGAHCKTPGAYYNEHGIGICLIGDMDDHRPSERQMQSLVRLVTFLQAQCGIPSSKIFTHGGVTHRTECPGRYFSMGDLVRRLNSSP